MDVLKIAICAISATNIMTIFSFVMSARYKSLFREPVVLNFILGRMGLCFPGKWKKITGWFAHYLIGLAFAISYEALWYYTVIPFGWLSGLGLGVASGVIGIMAWHLMYHLPDKKPHVPLQDYYLQLFFAHIIFAMAIVAAFKLYEYDPVSQVAAQF